MPGSGQWRMITEQPKGYNDCWVCNRHNYTIIIWNEQIGAHLLNEVYKEDQTYILGQIKGFN